MHAVRCVAGAVFRESVRDRVFYNLVLFAVLLVGASILIGQLTAGQDVKIIKDLGLTATSVFGLFVGLLLTLLVNVVVMTVALYAVLFYLSRGVPLSVQQAWDAPALDPALLKAIALIYLDLAVVT